MKEIRYDSTRGLLHAQGPLLGLIAVIFGIFVSTILTLVVIPTLYYAANYRHPERLAITGSEA
jgi:CBS domain containing-hemolysin-like protein